VFGLAAAILWCIEALAKRIGAKLTTVLLLGVLPSLFGGAVAYMNRTSLQWWELVLYTLAGPVVAVGLLLLGYLAVSPFGVPDLLTLLCSGLIRGAKATKRLILGR
jgi:hypothetical protein